MIFLRIFLIRILEDKRLLPNRLITDGGLELWVQTVRPRYAPHLGELSSETLIELALGQAEKIAGTLHRHDIYDWFIADDASILDILEVLHRYNFSQLATDVIGYTYQRFLVETERHRLGHYLTPPAVIDHILDAAEYVSGNLEIIGRDVLDPACGSGSFLVHAAVRYRQALAIAYRDRENDAATAFLEAIQERFIGIDINPFSCYLARINLLVQSFDDMARLRENAGLGDLRIYNADSLDFEGIRGEQTAIDPVLSDVVHRFKALRAEQIPYVFANPPYINVKQEDLYLSDIQSLPFFSDWLSGDANTYLLFLRIGIPFLAPNGTLAYIVPSTILGDQQSELFRRHVLADGFRLEHVMRFYAERVLFKPVEQATSVIVLRRTGEDRPVRVRGGGMRGGSVEAVADVMRRPAIELPAENIRTWISQTAVPVNGPLAAPTPLIQNRWIHLWPVMPEKNEHYSLWRALCSASQLTVNQLFIRTGASLSNVIKQGDVNTTHVKGFHVARDTDGAMPFYKGEEVDHLIPINYLPIRGPKGRSPFLTNAVEPANMTGPQRSALNELRRLASLREVQHGFVLHEVSKFRVPRRIAGTYFERGDGASVPVFAHTLWVATGPGERATLGLLGLLTSSTMNFAYHFCSTNNHVLMNLLSCLPVPERALAELPRIARLTEAALDRGGRLIELFERVGVDRGRALRTGVPRLDPTAFLKRSGSPQVRMRAWIERGWLEVPEGTGLIQRYGMAVLRERGRIRLKERDGLREVMDIWISAYGEMKWGEFENLSMPDDPASFLRVWTTAEGDLFAALTAHEQAISAIDETVAQLYRVPAELLNTLRTGPPWLAGRGTEAADEEAEDEGQEVMDL